ncbi:WhiB family transcriptional regulator [Streptomyces sp. NK08204]|uniref:WhiB family transcriptional regulator n=1 Tax=Streptomyces sp. NK08204 TaxID=2873260 RepID=UPI001CEC6340|nr:WhiB family transcriptional regulator [Streptomyces sp. NK08204]
MTSESNRKTSWYDSAACASRNIDPDIFHAGDRDQIEEARSVCAGCPVRAECLIDAYEVGDQWAIRGGLTDKERRHYLRLAEGHVARAVSEALDDVTVLVRHIYEQHTRRDGVHVVWTDTRHFINVRKQPYTIHQLAFLALFGVPPVGHVKRRCDVEECVGPSCLWDRRMRDAARWANADAGATKNLAA